MNQFLYKVTVIVPIYNVENYLNKSIESLLKQTINHNEMEVLLIDDGSSDNSLEICKRYSSLYSMFKVISKDNEGVSKTRNLGISLAKGKYILYLDADDSISENTVLNIYNFFEKNFEDIDLVTYPIRTVDVQNNLVGGVHYRYKFLNKTGIYSLEKFPYIVQTTMNICVKNDNNPVFFDETLVVHEDQDYITRILSKKGYIGYVHEAEYRYTKREDSVMNYISAINLWYPTINRYEKMFSEYKEAVPKYKQSLFFHDIKWKLVSDVLFPSHLGNKEYDFEITRMKKLLERVDVDIIVNHPEADIYHKYYWLSMKNNNGITVVCDNNAVMLAHKQEILYKRNKIELIAYRMLRIDDGIKLLFCAKSPVFSFKVKPVVYVREYSDNTYIEEKLDLFPSAYNYYKTRVKTNEFWAFYYECKNQEYSFDFQVEIDGMRFDTSYYFMPESQFDFTNGLDNNIYKGYSITFSENKFKTAFVSKEEKHNRLSAYTEKVRKLNRNIADLRQWALEMKDKGDIWLYYDCKGVKADNGYFQFIHDLKMNDGVQRYYISDNPKEMQEEIFEKDQMKYVIQFGTTFHKLLFINSSKIITAFIEENNYNPFSKEESKLLKDILHHQIVYLQHGILHAHLPWKYSTEKINIDKVVVSSYFEISNFIDNYGFREDMLIKSGMPRFDHFNISKAPKRKVLFAPTWRKYLIGNCIDNVWQMKEKEFLDSKFYKKIMNLINSEELGSILEKYNVEFDIKLHPIFKDYQDLFFTNNAKINFLNESQNDDEYSAFITDFSSYVFDFAYRKRSIIYFLPDKDEFKVGLNGYRELDLPFEKAFGPYCTDVDNIIKELEKIIKRDFQPEKIYKERMDNFYLPLNQCCEKVYKDLLGGKDK